MRPVNFIVHQWDHNNGIEKKGVFVWGVVVGGGSVSLVKAVFLPRRIENMAL